MCTRPCTLFNHGKEYKNYLVDFGNIVVGRSPDSDYQLVQLLDGALQVLAQAFSDAGVPVVAADVKGDLAGIAMPGTPGEKMLARAATLAPRLPDCRAEMRLTSDASSRARQEMTVMLAAPGMPLHQAPILTAKQASALMASICEPLLSLPVGRLTRKLSAPTKLQPTEDRGLISLWLLPDDSLSLVWQSAQQLEDPAAPLSPSCCSSTSIGYSNSGAAAEQQDGAASSSNSSSSNGGCQQAPLQQSCSVAVWEELAHFPAMAHLLEDAPGVQPRCCCWRGCWLRQQWAPAAPGRLLLASRCQLGLAAAAGPRAHTPRLPQAPTAPLLLLP